MLLNCIKLDQSSAVQLSLPHCGRAFVRGKITRLLKRTEFERFDILVLKGAENVQKTTIIRSQSYAGSARHTPEERRVKT